jgi:hypothetical protein
MSGRCVYCRRKPGESGRTFVLLGTWCCSDCAFHREYGYPEEAQSFPEPVSVELLALFDRDSCLR